MNSLRHTLHHALHLSLPQARSDARSTHSGRHISLRLRVSLALTALAGVLVLAASLLWVRDARSAINEEVTAAHRVAAQWLTVAAQGTQSGDPAWSENPVFDVMRQSYLTTADWMNGLVASVEGVDPRIKRRAKVLPACLDMTHVHRQAGGGFDFCQDLRTPAVQMRQGETQPAHEQRDNHDQRCPCKQ